MKTNFFKVLTLAGLAFVGFACNTNPEPESGAASINSISIVNGGLTGTERIAGVVDNEAETIAFENVPAETNIQAIRFDIQATTGYKAEQEAYDFLGEQDPATDKLAGAITITNSRIGVSKTYQVSISLKAPEQAPVIDKIVTVSDAGKEITVTATNVIDGLLMLGQTEANTVTIKEIVLKPARATYVFTTMNEGVISAANPGKLQLDFMGLTTEYDLTFSASPAVGADFSKAVVHDFSLNAGNMYADFAGDMVRGSDFDGEYALIVYRTQPKLFAVSDLLNDNAGNPILLNMDGVEGGTHTCSAGRLSHGHIYICNLATKIGAPNPEDETIQQLKVYHYANPTASPEVVLNWDGSGLADPWATRLGDNISVCLDDAGNGYAFFSMQEPGTDAIRFTVTNFTTFSDPYRITYEADKSYYGYFNQAGNGLYVFSCAYRALIDLRNAEGEVQYSVEMVATDQGTRLMHPCDPRIVEFNRARYLCFTQAPTNGQNWNYGPYAAVIDITEGMDVMEAFAKLNDAMKEEIYNEETDEVSYPWEPTYLSPMYDPEAGFLKVGACTAQMATAVVNGKLVLFSAAASAGFQVIEVPAAR